MSDDTNVAATATSEPAPLPAGARASATIDDKSVAKIADAVREKSPAEKAEAARKALDDDLRKVFRSKRKPRDEDGQFAPKDGAAPKAPEAPSPEAKEAAAAAAKEAKPSSEPPAEPHKETPPTSEGQKPDQGHPEPAKTEAKTPTPSRPAIEAPRSWPPERQAQWASLTPEMQQFLAHRERQVQDGFTRLGRHAKAMEPVRQIIEAHKGTFERNKLSVEEGLKALLTAQEALDRNPIEGIRWLAQTYGVDLGQLATTSDMPPDPAVDRLTRQVADLQRQLEAERAARTQREQAEVHWLESDIMRQIDQFAADKPDFDSLQAEIYANIAAIQQAKPELPIPDVLAQAYERARWANPATRQSIIEAREREIREALAKAEAERLAKEKKAAEEAKRASAINVRGAPSPSAPVNWDDDLKAIWRKNAAR
ncbi:MAG TPA: hypothetical protein VNK48_14625 [Xanthobacteraceae bacterium]|nr:hypothetical protein [Xanthobacteraceae bacterium]